MLHVKHYTRLVIPSEAIAESPWRQNLRVPCAQPQPAALRLVGWKKLVSYQCFT